VDQQLEGKSFLFGDKISYADVAIFPHLRQFYKTDPDWMESANYSALLKWIHYWNQSPLLEEVMKKVPVWKDVDGAS
jgi:glutathione S-transferase